MFFVKASARLNISANRGNKMLKLYHIVYLVYLTIQCQIMGSDYSKMDNEQTLMLIPK